MKFEKFLKGCGTYGHILTRSNGDKWLICGNVGMKVPTGVKTLLGSDAPEDPIANEVIKAHTADDVLTLHKAYLREADGKASDIIRVFATNLDIDLDCDTVEIYNGDYGLLEKKDLLTYLEVEDLPDDRGECKTLKFMVILNPSTKETVGFIQGR